MAVTKIVHLALCLRIIIAVCTRTFFQPDEYFQSLEPAFHIVFGYGHLTWEWLAPKPIRSIVYPAINVPVYWLLKVSGLADAGWLGDWLMIVCPRILHGALASATDIWLCELTRVTLGSAYVSTALFLSLTSFFHALSLSRSLSNSLETSLTTIAFAYYPWSRSTKQSPHRVIDKYRLRKVLMFSALACLVRPTNAVIWIFLIGNIFWTLRTHKKMVLALIKEVLAVGTTAILLVFVLDTLYYGKPTFTPFNFLLINLSSVSLFYGSNSWHYYLTQGIPILCTTVLPFTLHGMWLSLFKNHNASLRIMLGVTLWTITAFSFAGHKEWRFLHPILPLLHVFATKSLAAFSSRYDSKSISHKYRSDSKKPTMSKMILLPVPDGIIYFLLLSLPVSLYVILFYCSAPVTVTSFIRSLPPSELHANQTIIGVLMPCHSIPGHAYIQRRSLSHGGMWMLGCEPPLNGQPLAEYHHQTQMFYASPKTYFRNCFPDQVDASFPISTFPASIPGAPPPLDEYPWKHTWPKYLVLFGDLLRDKSVRDILLAQGYHEMWRHGREWEGEGERLGGVRVWKWR